MRTLWSVTEHMVIVAGGGWQAYKYLLGRHDKSRQRIEFIDEMRANHLPHIYRALQSICRKLNIDMEELNG